MDWKEKIASFWNGDKKTDDKKDGKKDDKIVDVKHAGRKVSVRWEMDTMPPFGFATYNTTGGLKNLKLKRL
jgi:hypothetical protein